MVGPFTQCWLTHCTHASRFSADPAWLALVTLTLLPLKIGSFCRFAAYNTNFLSFSRLFAFFLQSWPTQHTPFPFCYFLFFHIQNTFSLFSTIHSDHQPGCPGKDWLDGQEGFQISLWLPCPCLYLMLEKSGNGRELMRQHTKPQSL